MKFEKYYSPDKTEFRGYIIEHNKQFLSTDWNWTTAKTHACIITPEMLGGQLGCEVIASEQRSDLANGAVADTENIKEVSAQCCDCHFNWNFIGNINLEKANKERGWCFAYKNYQPDCIKKMKTNDYR